MSSKSAFSFFSHREDQASATNLRSHCGSIYQYEFGACVNASATSDMLSTLSCLRLFSQNGEMSEKASKCKMIHIISKRVTNLYVGGENKRLDVDNTDQLTRERLESFWLLCLSTKFKCLAMHAIAPAQTRKRFFKMLFWSECVHLDQTSSQK